MDGAQVFVGDRFVSERVRRARRGEQQFLCLLAEREFVENGAGGVLGRGVDGVDAHDGSGLREMVWGGRLREVVWRGRLREVVWRSWSGVGGLADVVGGRRSARHLIVP